ncbi:MAG: septation protein SpoVG family protein [Deltaproteobacteria bacterium]
MLEFKVNRINKIENPQKSLRAFVDIEIGASLLVKGLRVMDGQNGLFVKMPQQKGRDNKWYETVRPLSQDIKDRIAATVLQAYGAVTEKA